MKRLMVATLFGACLSLPSAWAQAKPDPKKAKPLLTQAPRTCTDQCTIIANTCFDPCKQSKASGQVKNACRAQCDQLTLACEESCREKGRLEGEYLLKRMGRGKGGAGKGARR